MTGTDPEKRLIGYARVSTYGQTLDSQLEQLRAAGCTATIYREKVTGAHNDRRELLGSESGCQIMCERLYGAAPN
jgi:predicted site-specific integrase-resolvase